MDNNSSAGNGSGSNQTKSSSVAAVLNLLLGTLGVHNFYLGKTMYAVIELIIGAVLYMMPFITSASWPSIVFSIYGILIAIEGILIITGQTSSGKYAISEPSKNWHKIVLLILLVIRIVISVAVMISAFAG